MKKYYISSSIGGFALFFLTTKITTLLVDGETTSGFLTILCIFLQFILPMIASPLVFSVVYEEKIQDLLTSSFLGCVVGLIPLFSGIQGIIDWEVIVPMLCFLVGTIYGESFRQKTKK